MPRYFTNEKNEPAAEGPWYEGSSYTATDDYGYHPELVFGCTAPPTTINGINRLAILEQYDPERYKNEETHKVQLRNLRKALGCSGTAEVVAHDKQGKPEVGWYLAPGMREDLLPKIVGENYIRDVKFGRRERIPEVEAAIIRRWQQDEDEGAVVREAYAEEEAKIKAKERQEQQRCMRNPGGPSKSHWRPSVKSVFPVEAAAKEEATPTPASTPKRSTRSVAEEKVNAWLPEPATPPMPVQFKAPPAEPPTPTTGGFPDLVATGCTVVEKGFERIGAIISDARNRLGEVEDCRKQTQPAMPPVRPALIPKTHVPSAPAPQPTNSTPVRPRPQLRISGQVAHYTTSLPPASSSSRVSECKSPRKKLVEGDYVIPCISHAPNPSRGQRF